jgi:hypothetical protein
VPATGPPVAAVPVNAVLTAAALAPLSPLLLPPLHATTASDRAITSAARYRCQQRGFGRPIAISFIESRTVWGTRPVLPPREMLGAGCDRNRFY